LFILFTIYLESTVKNYLEKQYFSDF